MDLPSDLSNLVPFGTLLLVLAITLVLVWLVLQRVGKLDARFDGLARTSDLERTAAIAAEAAAAAATASDERHKRLEEGLRRIAESVGRLPPALEPKDLVPLQERLEAVTRALDELRHHVDELRSRDPQVAPAVAPGANVLRTLQQRGFESIRIVGDVAEDDSGETSRVPVEARRDGMSFKGFVTLEDGRVGEVALKPVTEVFP